ncbi:hypothetical protein [Oerskovia turbata]
MTELDRSATPSARAGGPAREPRLVEPLPTPLRSLAEGLLQVAYALVVGGAASLLGGLVVGGVAPEDATRLGEIAAASISVSLGVVAGAVVLLGLANAASTLLLGAQLAQIAATNPEAVPPTAVRDRVRQDDPVRPVAALCWSLLVLAAIAALVVAPALLSDDATSAAGARLLVVATATIAVVGVLLAVLVRRGRRAWSRVVASLDRVWTPAVVRAATRNERPADRNVSDGAPPVAPHGKPPLHVLGHGAVGVAAVAGPTALAAVRTTTAATASGAAADAGIAVATACALLVVGGAVALVAAAPSSGERRAARGAAAKTGPRRRGRDSGR